MRLGGHCYEAATVDDLEPLAEKLDTHGLSAIAAPRAMPLWTDEACAA